MKDKGKKIFFYISEFSRSNSNLLKVAEGPFMGPKKSVSHFQGSWYSKPLALSHGLNAAIGFEKYALHPDIVINMCANWTCQAKPFNFLSAWGLAQTKPITKMGL